MADPKYADLPGIVSYKVFKLSIFQTKHWIMLVILKLPVFGFICVRLFYFYQLSGGWGWT